MKTGFVSSSSDKPISVTSISITEKILFISSHTLSITSPIILFYVVLGIGKLEEYKLAFTKKSAKWNGGVLDVVTSRNHDYVLGLVIQVSDRALRAIDRREGVSAGAYKRETVGVDLGGEVVEAIVYTVVNKERSGVKASEEYVSKVETGMREEGFPEEYINILKELKKSFIPYESIDCVNADLNNKIF